MTTPWQPGQRAIIDRRAVVTIDRVTPSGRAVVGNRRFGANGMEIGGGSTYRIAWLAHLTPEIEAELAFIERARDVCAAAFKEVEAADAWLRRNLSSWSPRTPEAADVDRAERLAAAIRQVMEGVG